MFLQFKKLITYKKFITKSLYEKFDDSPLLPRCSLIITKGRHEAEVWWHSIKVNITDGRCDELRLFGFTIGGLILLTRHALGRCMMSILLSCALDALMMMNFWKFILLSTNIIFQTCFFRILCIFNFLYFFSVN